MKKKSISCIISAIKKEEKHHIAIKIITLLIVVSMFINFMPILPTQATTADEGVIWLPWDMVRVGGTIIFEFCDGMALFKYDDKYGFIDKTGKIAIPAIYDYTDTNVGYGIFKDGLAWMCKDGKYGCIDKSGNVVIPFIYDEFFIYDVDFFVEGLARVKKDGKCGFIDKTGKEVIPLEYDYFRYFNEGMAYVEKDGKFGYINKTGKSVIPLEYSTTYSNYNIFEDGTVIIPLNYGGNGLFDRNGKNILPEEYSILTKFNEDYAGVRFRSNGNYCGFVDETFKVIIPPDYRDVRMFSEGLAAVEKDGKYGFINTKNEIIISFKYDVASRYHYFGDETYRFDGGIALVNIGYEDYDVTGKWGVIDQAGKEIIPVEYDAIRINNFPEGLIGVNKGYTNKAGSGKWGIFDKTGKEIVPLIYDDISSSGFCGDLLAVSKGGKWGFIDQTGKEVVPLIYDRVSDFNEGIACAYKGVYGGYIDKTGKEVFPLIHNAVNEFREGLACFRTNYPFRYGIMSNPLLQSSNSASEKVVNYSADGKVDTLDTSSPWAKDSIKAALTKGFVPLNLQNNYTDNITRAEFCLMAIKFVEYKTGKSIDTIMMEGNVSRNTESFIDTSHTSILAAYALNIVSGYNNKFSPNSVISREQAAVMIRNTCEVLGFDISNSPTSVFTDIGSAEFWAVEAINFCYANRIMNGSNNKFGPKSTFSREQSIIAFNNIK